MKTLELSLKVLDTATKEGKMSSDDLADLKSGKKQMISDEIFLRKKLTGTSGVVEVINENDITKNCITNLSKGAIPAEKNIVVSKIALRFGFSATDVDPAAVPYSNAIFDLGDVNIDGGVAVAVGNVYARRIPVQLQNAEFVLTVDGIVMDSGRVADLLTQNVSTDAVIGNEKNFKELEYPKLFSADKRVKFDLKFPDNGAAVPAGFYYVELVAKGLGLGKRS